MNQNKELMLRKMKSQTFGVEIEMYGLPFDEIARHIASFFNTSAQRETYDHDSCGLPSYVIRDEQRRKWTLVTDASIHDDYDNYPRTQSGQRQAKEKAGEMVTPPLKYDDIELLQKLVRYLKDKGLKSGVKGGCGVHIHIGADFNKAGGHTIQSLINFANLVKNHQRLIKNAIQFNSSRERWAGNLNDSFIKKINARNFSKEYKDLESAWYTSAHCNIPQRADHYNISRYQLMNLHGFFNKKLLGKDNQMTIEFRCFEFKENMHAGKLKAWIQLVLAMSSYSKSVDYVKRKEIEIYNNPKNSMKNWLLNMGLTGEEFKTCRELLMRYLNGDSASRTPRERRPRTERIDNLEI